MKEIPTSAGRIAPTLGLIGWKRSRAPEEIPIPARLHYRGQVYRIENGCWRGPDGHTVHLLTWITDDLSRLGKTEPEGPDPDLETASKVAERLGSDAEVQSASPPAGRDQRAGGDSGKV